MAEGKGIKKRKRSGGRAAILDLVDKEFSQDNQTHDDASGGQYGSSELGGASKTGPAKGQSASKTAKTKKASKPQAKPQAKPKPKGRP